MIDKLKSVWEYYDDHKQFCDCRGQTQSKFKDHLVANKKVQTAANDEESAPVTDVAQPKMNKDTLDMLNNLKVENRGLSRSCRRLGKEKKFEQEVFLLNIVVIVVINMWWI